MTEPEVERSAGAAFGRPADVDAEFETFDDAEFAEAEDDDADTDDDAAAEDDDALEDDLDADEFEEGDDDADTEVDSLSGDDDADDDDDDSTRRPRPSSPGPWPRSTRSSANRRPIRSRRSPRRSRRCRRRSPASTPTDTRLDDVMARRIRLDAELVRRGLARSREQAAELVAAGRVEVRGTVAAKVAAMVDPADPLLVRGGDPTTEYVSRGGHKLAGALAAFTPLGLVVAGRRCLDAGASTGGFTDVLLRAGAREVVAVDVGYGQLAWSIRTDERVRVHDRTNVRSLTPDDIGGTAELIVADLSFISLRLVLDAFVACLDPGGDLVPMVKPQFEVGKERVGSGGVVRDPALRADAVLDVAAEARQRGLGVAGVVTSPLPGPVGQRRILPVVATDTVRGHRRRRSGAWWRPA